MHTLDTMIMLLLLFAALWFYLLPAIIAGRRRHRNAEAIAMFNILLGWTFLGWVLALVWALTDSTGDIRIEKPE